MEQDQFKVSFSLRSKLLLALSGLLFVVILFLNYSSYVLFRDDKVAYVYELQSKEAVLAGKEFTNLAQQSLDTLRQTLASYNPARRTLTATGRKFAKDLFNNQGQMAELYIFRLKNEQLEKVFYLSKDEEREPNVVEADFLPMAKSLKTNGYGFFNLSTVNERKIGIARADTAFKDNVNGMPIAVSVVPMNQFLTDVNLLGVTITTRSGAILFSSDPQIALNADGYKDSPLFKESTRRQVIAGAKEYEYRNVRYLGSYFKAGLGVVAFSRMTYDDAILATYRLSVKFMLLGLMAVGLGMIFTVLFARSLSAPLRKLYEATKEVAKGKFDLNLKSKSKDEIGALSSSFNVMSQKIGELIEESVEKTRMEGELAIASTVQQTLIPPSEHFDQNFSVHSYYEPASECGGDWWGFFRKGNQAAIFIADATGHGLPSALITAAARSCFSVISKLYEENPEIPLSPSQMLGYANRAIYDAATGKIMMTFFAAVIDFDQMSLTFSSAGHNPPWLFQKTPEGFQLKSLVAKGNRLGEGRDVPDYEEKTIRVSPQDVLCLYTDGILEGTNKIGVMYGKKRMKKMIESAIGSGPKEMIQSLINDFKEHNDDKPLDDDITIAVAQIQP